MRTTERVLEFIDLLKTTVSSKFKVNVKLKSSEITVEQRAFNLVIRQEQYKHFDAEFDYFESGLKNIKDIPENVQRFNLYKDEDKLLRVRSKFGRFNCKKFHPVFLPNDNPLTELLILHYHKQTSHGGVYSVLNILRKSFWIPNVFVLVKRLLKKCLVCKRLNQRSCKFNQSSYREFRVNPPNIPFRALFMDYLGPFYVRRNEEKVKVYLLLFSCLWSRCINLKICFDLSLNSFLKAFQLHVFDYGLPEFCHSDLGSQLVAGSNLISEFLNNETSL